MGSPGGEYEYWDRSGVTNCSEGAFISTAGETSSGISAAAATGTPAETTKMPADIEASVITIFLASIPLIAESGIHCQKTRKDYKNSKKFKN